MLVQQVSFFENLWNDEFLPGFRAIGQWARDQVPFPGAASSEPLTRLVGSEDASELRLKSGHIGFVAGRRPRSRGRRSRTGSGAAATKREYSGPRAAP